MWVRVHGGWHPAEAAPPIGRLLMMFAAAFGWTVFLTAVMPWPELKREEVHGEIADLYKSFILNYRDKLDPHAISSICLHSTVLAQASGLIRAMQQLYL